MLGGAAGTAHLQSSLSSERELSGNMGDRPYTCSAAAPRITPSGTLWSPSERCYLTLEY